MRERCKLSELLAGVAVVSAALLFSPWMHAQVDAGTVVGAVRDEAGSGLGDVKVILKDEATSITKTTDTRDNGTYIFTAVKSGSYTVSAEPQKFAPAVQTGVIVNIQERVSVNFSLQAGAANPVTQETAKGSAARPQDTSVGDVIGSAQLGALPVNNRNYAYLARLASGVTSSQSSAKGLNTSGSFVANGMPAAQNNYLLDGIDNNSHLVDFLTGNAFVVLPPMDAIQEFRVQGPNYSAALGRTAGTVLNVVTRSGTSQLHGSAWDYFGNDKLNAADFFDNAAGVKKAEFRKNQYGAALGGPLNLGKGINRSFFFVDYQGTSIRQGVPTVTTVPTSVQRNSGFSDFSDLISAQPGCTRGPDLLGRTVSCGQILDPTTTRLVLAGGVDPVTGLTASNTGYVRDSFPGNIIPSSRVNSVAAGLLSLYPVPNKSGIRNNYTTNVYRTVDARAFDVRLDHSFSSKNQLFGRFSYYDDPQRQAGPFEGYADGGGYTQVASSRNVVLSETHISSPTLTNEVRLGFSGLHAGRVQPYANILTNIPRQYGIQGIPQTLGNGGLPTLAVGSLSTLGSSPSLYTNDFSSTVQVSDNVTKVFRGHTLRAGIDLMHLKVSTLQPPYSRGQFSFTGNYTSISNMVDATTGVAQFLLTPMLATTVNGVNLVGGPSQVLASNITNIDNRRNYIAGYFGDDWKVRPKLTVNLGVRWEYFEPAKENYSAEANFIPGTPGQDAQYLIPVGRGEDSLSTSFTDKLENDGIDLIYTQRGNLVRTSKKNFAPRLALAYQITPKLVARAGYGIYYGGLDNQGTLTNLGGNYPFQVNHAFNSPNDGSPIIYPAIATNAILELGLAGTPLNPSVVNASQLMLRGVQQNYQTPYAQGLNLTFEYEIAPHSLVELSYAGSLGCHLPVNPGLNEVSQLLPPKLNRQSYVPFPDFAYGSSYIATEGSSYYHSGRLRFTRKLSNGLSFVGDYTYSKTRTDALDLPSSGGTQSYRAPYIEGFGIQGDYGLASFDIRHAAHFSGIYELPVGAGKHFLSKNSGILGKIIGGWNLSWVFTQESGQPVTIPCNITTASGAGCYALLVSGQDPTAGSHQANQFWNAAAFTNPEVATSVGQSDLAPLGGAPTQVAGPGYNRLDVALRKSFRTSANTHLELRAEAYNVSNHPNFAQPTNLDFTDSTSFGLSNATRDNPNGARQIQFALKLYF